MPITVVETPYGRPAVEALRDVVAGLKAGDAMAPVLVVVPNNIAGIVARRALARGVNSRGGIAGIDVTTLAKLAERLAASTLAPRRPATCAVLAAAWRRELAADPLAFAAIAENPATVRAGRRAPHAARPLR